MNVVHWRTVGKVGIITLNRPEKRNAIDEHAARLMESMLDTLENDPNLAVGVVAAEGKVFSSGGDLSLVAEGRAYDSETTRGGFAGLVRRERTKPLIAACDGPAIAGGAEIALACDMIVASENAWFAFPEVKRALIAGAGGVFRLPRVIPPALATELLLTGKPLSASRAFELGLVNELTEPDEALSAALRLADDIAAGSPMAIQQTLELIRELRHASDVEAFAACDASRALLEQSADYYEGSRAFLEKRPPVWSGITPKGEAQ